jgi:hypothetical protein
MSYDPRAVKVGKTIKRMSALMAKPNERRAYFKMYVAVLAAESKSRGRSSRSDSGE